MLFFSFSEDAASSIGRLYSELQFLRGALRDSLTARAREEEKYRKELKERDLRVKQELFIARRGIENFRPTKK